MPIYEYKCSECNTRFDVLHKSTLTVEDVHCPACDSKNNIKLFSAFSANVSSNSHSLAECSSDKCQTPASGCSNGLCGLN